MKKHSNKTSKYYIDIPHLLIIDPPHREDPLISLNFAVFLYNTNDVGGTKREYRLYDKKKRALKNVDIDREVR